MRSIKARWSALAATGRRLALRSFFPPMSSRMQSGCANALPSSRVEKSDSKEKFRKRATAYVRRCGLKPERPKVRGALHCLPVQSVRTMCGIYPCRKDRKSVVEGKSGSGRVDLGGGGIIK